MTKIAFLVLCSLAPRVLRQLCSHFPPDQFLVFAHVDAKVDDIDYKSQVGEWAHLCFVEPRREVFWGGFSMVEATLDLAQRALDDPHVSFLALVSDDSFPLLSPDQLMRTLTGAGHSWIQSWTIPKDHMFQERYSKYFYFDSRFTSPRWFLNEHRSYSDADYLALLELQALKFRGKAPLENLYCGKQWWTLSRGELEKILEVHFSNKHLRDSFRFSAVPDETYIQTLFRICWPDRKQLGNPMLDDFSRHPQPFVFESYADLQRFRSGGNKDPSIPPINREWLFVRKIHPHAEHLAHEIAENWRL